LDLPVLSCPGNCSTQVLACSNEVAFFGFYLKSVFATAEHGFRRSRREKNLESAVIFT